MLGKASNFFQADPKEGQAKVGTAKGGITADTEVAAKDPQAKKVEEPKIGAKEGAENETKSKWKKELS